MAGEGEDGANVRELDKTPTWAVAGVCLVIIVTSVLLEKGLYYIGKWLTEKRKKALYEAIEKIKAELMILGFISLLLTFLEKYIVKICIPITVADTMLPCRNVDSDTTTDVVNEGNRRRLLLTAFEYDNSYHRILAQESVGGCPGGKVSLISADGVQQLHILIFFLAVFHVVNSALTMALGRAKMRRWKEWEKETLSLDYQFSNDPSRFRFTSDTSFVKLHTSIWNRNTILLYIVSFFKQFFMSVRQTDYLTLRHGFINTHLAPGSKFNFQKYIKRTLDNDFKVVVGISPILWGSSLIVLLFNVHGWKEMFWASMVPLVIILVVGTKLQAIITRMAVEIQDRHTIVQGIPLVKLSDHHFWFGRPEFLLFLIHFCMFQNAFEITYFFWIWYEFSLKSCFHENFSFIIARVVICVGIQVLCSYVTLPLYALVSQMGSNMKMTIFDEQTSKALRKWHQVVKKKLKESPHSSTTSPSSSPIASPFTYSARTMQRHKTIGHNQEVVEFSLRRYYSNNESLGSQGKSLKRNKSDNEIIGLSEDQLQLEEQLTHSSFSFANNFV